MELANCLVALAGDRNNTVPKWGVTPAEVAVLIAIHGEDAVFDIAPTGGSVTRSVAEELERLMFSYPARDEKQDLILTKVYAGQRPMIHKTFADLYLPADAYATTKRAAPVFVDPEPEPEEAPAAPVAEEAPAKPKKAPKAAKAEEPEAPAEVVGSDNADSLFDD